MYSVVVEDIRLGLVDEFTDKNFIADKTGKQTVEILGASFIANADAIFGKPNSRYIRQEIDWYNSESTNIYDITNDGKAPQAWKYAADTHGNINSNYGYLIHSDVYYNQFNSALNALLNDKLSRRGTMVYNRPSIQVDYNQGGKSDFICTNAVTYLIRERNGIEYMDCVVQMRSNDAWAGYRNDFAWQQYVLTDMLDEYNHSVYTESDTIVQLGDIHWQVQSLHVYSTQFYLLDHFAMTGEHNISKEEYRSTYDTPWCA